MNTSFDAMKKSRGNQLEKLAKLAKDATATRPSADDRFWKPTIDSAGNGSAIIRFLPAPAGSDVPFVRYWDHGFQGPGGWYIEKSRTTLGEDDPVSVYNTKLWHAGSEADKEQARKQKRRLHYVSNIFVISDPDSPQNEGKVFLYTFGKKIFDKINDLMHPEFADEGAVNPFDLWEGANFRLRIRNYEGFRNYDKSSFDSPSALYEDDSVLEKIWKSEYPLDEFVDPKNFKDYAELKAKLVRVLGHSIDDPASSNTGTKEETDLPWTPPEESPRSKAKESSEVDFDDDDDSLEFFKKLAAE